VNKVNEIANMIIIIASAITAILAIIEKTNSIKWKPLTKLFGRKELYDKLDNIANQQKEFMTQLNRVEDENDKREIKRLRAYILEYANKKCGQGIKMSSEQETYFDECCTDYEQLISKYNLVNGHAKQSIKQVSDYRKMELADKYRNNLKKQ
jgi:hypothetical protein